MYCCSKNELTPLISFPCPVVKGEFSETFAAAFCRCNSPNQKLIVKRGEAAGVLLLIQFKNLLSKPY